MSDLDLHVLARFLPEFERSDFSPGVWTPMQKRDDGSCTSPYVDLSPVAADFVKAAYDSGCVLTGFDWGLWKETEEARALHANFNLLAQATPQQLAQLLTVFIRQERFLEGALLQSFEDGHMVAIVRRAAQLLQDEGAQ